MNSQSKKTTDSSSAGAIPARLLFVAAFTLLAVAVASLLAFEGRASSRGPSVSIVADTSIVSICPAGSAPRRVHLRAEGVPTTCAAGHYKWKATGGTIVGEGPNVDWDFTGTRVDFSKEREDQPSNNFYDVTLTVEGGEGCGGGRAVSLPRRVVAWDCPPTVKQGDSPTPVPDLAKRTREGQCPNISLCCHAVGAGQYMPLSATLSGGTPGVTPIFDWKVYGGEVVSGQGTASIMVDYSDYEEQPIVATLKVSGYGPGCSASCAPERRIDICRPHYEPVTRYRRVYIRDPDPIRPIVKHLIHPRPRRHRSVVVRPRGHWVLHQETTSILVACPPAPPPGKRKS